MYVSSSQLSWQAMNTKHVRASFPGEKSWQIQNPSSARCSFSLTRVVPWLASPSTPWKKAHRLLLTQFLSEDSFKTLWLCSMIPLQRRCPVPISKRFKSSSSRYNFCRLAAAPASLTASSSSKNMLRIRLSWGISQLSSSLMDRILATKERQLMLAWKKWRRLLIRKRLLLVFWR